MMRLRLEGEIRGRPKSGLLLLLPQVLLLMMTTTTTMMMVRLLLPLLQQTSSKRLAQARDLPAREAVARLTAVEAGGCHRQ